MLYHHWYLQNHPQYGSFSLKLPKHYFLLQVAANILIFMVEAQLFLEVVQNCLKFAGSSLFLVYL